MKVIKTFLFYLISFTWGLPASIIGFLITFSLWVTGHRSYVWNYCIVTPIGKNWGGMSIGPFIFTDNSPTEHILQHEHGHSIQNLMLGPLWLFIVGIPSGIRYQYREVYIYNKDRVRYRNLPDYDSVWFEKWATKLGEKYFPKKEGEWIR